MRSELVVPILLRDRCLGVFDLQSPELGAFEKRHVGILTLLAGQAAVAIENARLYRKVRANESRLRKEMRLAQRVQAGLQPASLPTHRGVDVAARFEPALELGGDFYDVLAPGADLFVTAVGDVSGKGAAAALYGAFAGGPSAADISPSSRVRRPSSPRRTRSSTSVNSRGTFARCATRRSTSTAGRRSKSNAGLPFPVRSTAAETRQIGQPGIPLGLFPGSTYDEESYPIAQGDVFVFCTDGIFEATDDVGDEFVAERLIAVIQCVRDLPARTIIDAIFEAVGAFHGGAAQGDDMTAVVLKITE